MRFLAWIREIQRRLHECAESIHRNEERKRNKYLPPDKPIEVRAVVSFDEKTVADATTQSNRTHTTQESIKKATWYAFFAVAIYALISLAMWCQMIRQNRIASAALIQAEKQWKAQHRPWLGLEDNAISISPTLEFAWSPALAYPTIYVGPVNYVIKNVGAAPAFHEWDTIYALPNPDGQKPVKLLEVLCQMREGIGKGHTETSDGDFLLSGNQKHVSMTINIPNPPPMHLESIWLIVCVSYEDSWKSAEVHHSRYLYMSVPGPALGFQPRTPNPAHPDWTYVPIKGVYLNGAQAD